MSMVKNALDLEININEFDNYYFIPLQVAAKHGYYDIAKLLLERGADPDLVKDFCLSIYDSEFDFSAFSELPLSTKDTFNHRELSALQLAIKHNQIELVKLLLVHGADVSPNVDLDTVHLSLAAKDDNQEIMELLVEAAANQKKDLEYDLAMNCVVTEELIESLR